MLMAFVHLTPRLPVADLQRTIAFYRDVLGFTVDLIWPDEVPTFAVLVRDDVEMAFFVLDEHRPGTIGYAEVYVEVTDAAALNAQLKDQVAIEMGTRRVCVWSARVRNTRPGLLRCDFLRGNQRSADDSSTSGRRISRTSSTPSTR